MNAPAREIAAILDNAGLGVLGALTGWGIYAFREPDEPDTVITVYDTGGFGLFNEPDNNLVHPTFQVRVRSFTYDDAYVKQVAVRDTLMDSPLPVAITDGVVVGAWATTGVLSLGPDEKERHRLVSNYRLIIEEN